MDNLIPENDRFEIIDEMQHEGGKKDIPNNTTKNNIDPLDKVEEVTQELNELKTDDSCINNNQDLGDEKGQSKEVDPLTEEEKIVKTKESSNLKEKGNSFFVQKNFNEAIDCYSQALQTCPKTDDLAYNRAVCFSNRAACHIYLENYDEAIEDCNFAIKLDSKYVKAYMRRSKAYEEKDNMEEALKDINSVLEIDPTIRSAVESQKRLSKIVTERQEKMKEEMMGKLKDIGNSLLGKFGLSTDNFQMKQDPNTGSYNIQFVQNLPK